MRANRPLAVLAALLLVAATTLAQEAKQRAEPRRIATPVGDAMVLHERADAEPAGFTLWVAYRDDRGDFLDHARYLADLTARYQEQAVTVAVAMPRQAAARVAQQQPDFLVAAVDDPAAIVADSTMFVCKAANDAAPLGWQGLDGAVDLLEGRINGTPTLPAAHLLGELQSLLDNVADGGEFEHQVELCVKALPHSGRARAAAVLYQWWCRGDLAAAREAIDQGLEALAGDAVPMCMFVDLVLRGDRNDPHVARALAVAMGPVAAAAPAGVFTQLVYLRALLRAGQDRLAGRIAATLPRQLQGRAEQQLVFAETLMEADAPAAYRDLASRAIADAEQIGGFERWGFCSKHKLLVRCGDALAADKLLADYHASDSGRLDLNDDAWYLIVQPATMGRFDTLALALTKEMGAQLDTNSKDTVALACFVNGQVDKAVELQTEAVSGANATPIFGFRLARYRATQKQLAERKQADKASRPR